MHRFRSSAANSVMHLDVNHQNHHDLSAPQIRKKNVALLAGLLTTLKRSRDRPAPRGFRTMISLMVASVWVSPAVHRTMEGRHSIHNPHILTVHEGLRFSSGQLGVIGPSNTHPKPLFCDVTTKADRSSLLPRHMRHHRHSFVKFSHPVWTAIDEPFPPLSEPFGLIGILPSFRDEHICALFDSHGAEKSRLLRWSMDFDCRTSFERGGGEADEIDICTDVDEAGRREGRAGVMGTDASERVGGDGGAGAVVKYQCSTRGVRLVRVLL